MRKNRILALLNLWCRNMIIRRSLWFESIEDLLDFLDLLNTLYVRFLWYCWNRIVFSFGTFLKGIWNIQFLAGFVLFGLRFFLSEYLGIKAPAECTLTHIVGDWFTKLFRCFHALVSEYLTRPLVLQCYTFVTHHSAMESGWTCLHQRASINVGRRLATKWRAFLFPCLWQCDGLFTLWVVWNWVVWLFCLLLDCVHLLIPQTRS